MKKLIGLLIFLFAVSFTQQTVAQSKRDLRGIESITFYGVDFSLAKIYGSDDAFEKLQNAFEGINDLFESEPKKYDIGKTLGIRYVDLFNSQVNEKIDEIKANSLFTRDNRYMLSNKEIDKLVKKLKKEGRNKYGAIIITGLLNKTANQGTFTYVVFEQDTNEVIFQKELTGKAKGFGLRNFWAGALYATMKQIK